MRKTIILFYLLFPLFLHSQNSYIVDKKGEKTIIRDDAIDIISIDDRISYKLPGKTWEKYITYKNLDHAILNGKYFKAFKLKRKRRGLFVIAEDGNKKLAGISVVTTTTSSSYSNSILRVYYYVIENDDTVLLELSANDSKSKSAISNRKKVYDQIKLFFPDCQELIGRLNYNSESDYMSILYLTQTPYITCN